MHMYIYKVFIVRLAELKWAFLKVCMLLIKVIVVNQT